MDLSDVHPHPPPSPAPRRKQVKTRVEIIATTAEAEAKKASLLDGEDKPHPPGWRFCGSGKEFRRGDLL